MLMHKVLDPLFGRLDVFEPVCPLGQTNDVLRKATGWVTTSPECEHLVLDYSPVEVGDLLSDAKLELWYSSGVLQGSELRRSIKYIYQGSREMM
jgi:hypothetical protein